MALCICKHMFSRSCETAFLLCFLLHRATDFRVIQQIFKSDIKIGFHVSEIKDWCLVSKQWQRNKSNCENNKLLLAISSILKKILNTTLKSKASSANLCILQLTDDCIFLKNAYPWQKLFNLFYSSSETWVHFLVLEMCQWVGLSLYFIPGKCVLWRCIL